MHQQIFSPHMVISDIVIKTSKKSETPSWPSIPTCKEAKSVAKVGW